MSNAIPSGDDSQRLSAIQSKLVECFSTVFPDLDPGEIPTASQATVPQWDSIGALTLVSVLEEQFQTPIDLEAVVDLDSFHRILEYLSQWPEIGTRAGE